MNDCHMLICIHKDLHFISNTKKSFDNVVYQNAVCQTVVILVNIVKSG